MLKLKPGFKIGGQNGGKKSDFKDVKDHKDENFHLTKNFADDFSYSTLPPQVTFMINVGLYHNWATNSKPIAIFKD